LPMATVNLFISQLLGAVYLLTIAAVLWREYTRRHRPAAATAAVPLPRLRLGLLGLVAGCIVGLTSVGSGSLYVALLALVYPVATAKLVGTDILQGVLVTGVAGLVHFAFGSVDLPMVASLLVGSIPGILIGSRITVRIPDGAIRAGVLLMLGWSSYSLLLR
ncbi:MAG: sulfite exporter TauE/SafE family protein, partial [Alicyclobacillus sp.]|nr:sulfite exporter TauE/SafE family protein [Alicyclobacillus sp.]